MFVGVCLLYIIHIYLAEYVFNIFDWFINKSYSYFHIIITYKLLTQIKVRVVFSIYWITCSALINGLFVSQVYTFYILDYLIYNKYANSFKPFGSGTNIPNLIFNKKK